MNCDCKTCQENRIQEDYDRWMEANRQDYVHWLSLMQRNTDN